MPERFYRDTPEYRQALRATRNKVVALATLMVVSVGLIAAVTIAVVGRIWGAW